MKYKLRDILDNIPSSIVVSLVALPLCLGIALGSNAPLMSGIIAGVIGGIVIGSLSNSPLSVSGPAAGLIAVVVLAIEKLGSFENFLLASMIAGLIQIIFGYLKFGKLGDFIPNSVIKGLLAAIGIILILKQIPHFVGYDNQIVIDEIPALPQEDNSILFLLDILNYINTSASFIGAMSMISLLVLEFKYKKLAKIVPAPLIAVVIGTILNYILDLINTDISLNEQHLVAIPEISNFANNFIFPNFDAIINPSVFTTAITIALVASIETLLCIEATDKLDKFKRRTDANRELQAQGVGNIASAAIGGLPITSVIVRSSANANAGATSKLSAILHGVWLLLAVVMIPNIISKIPYSSLAAILIFTGYKLTKPSIFKDLYRLGGDQLTPFIITIIAILLTNLLLGVFIGIVASFFFILHSNFKSSLMMVHNHKHYLIRLRKDVSFLNKVKLKNMLEKIPSNSYVIVDISRADFIDKDVIEVINDFSKHAGLKKISIEIKKNNFKALHRMVRGNIKLNSRII